MLTRLRIANFKRFTDVEIPLDSPVVLVGGNGSGKTAALQALALWELGLRTFHARRAALIDYGGHSGNGQAPRPVPAARQSRPLGVTLRRRDLTQIPLPTASHLWHRTELRASKTTPTQRAQPLRIELAVDGITGAERWSCGLEFDYTNDDSLMCRPLRLPEFVGAKVQGAKFSTIPEPATAVHVAYLPPMSGVSVSEPKWELGRVHALLGEGQTAQVIRNLCLHLYTQKPDRGHWQRLCLRMQTLFGVRLQNPEFIAEHGEIVMKYRDADGTRLDLSAAGKGMLQTLLLLGHAYMNPGAVLLLDEPCAHLEPLRQRQILRTLLAVASEQGCQVIATSHSEIVISEVAGRGSVVLLGPGRARTLFAVPASLPGETRAAGASGQQTLFAGSGGRPGEARDAGWADHLQAAQTGWVLYLPGPQDLAILYAMAQRLGHRAGEALEQPLCHYIGEGPEAVARARRHFNGLRALQPALRGVALYSQPDPAEAPTLPAAPAEPLHEHTWQRGDLDSYYALDEVLLAYAHQERSAAFDAAASSPELAPPPPLRQLQLVAMLSPEQRRREQAMRTALAEVKAALRTLGRLDRLGAPSRTRTEFLRPVLRRFEAQLGPTASLREGDYPALIRLLTPERVDAEILHQLDAIARAQLLAEAQRPPTAGAARPAAPTAPSPKVSP